MDSMISYNDDENIESHLPNSQCLEMVYQQTLRNAQLIVKDEGARRLRLRILLLESQNEDLHGQLALDDDRMDTLEQDGDALRAQLEHAQKHVSRYETELRAQAREINNLKAELTSMNGVTIDSTKVLTEKLSLARELATLKPELDHLRTQASYQQGVLSEKLALQRQVSTLEVELETEKRASKRAAQKSNNGERDLEFQQQLDILQKDLVREKRERDKDRKDAEKELKAAESRKNVLESKMDMMRETLRAIKGQLKECQTELEQSRVVGLKSSLPSAKADLPAQTRQKRGYMEMSTDNTDAGIGTPDGVAIRGKRPAAKRGRMDQTILGEKSMFSITPYLNRAINMGTETSAHKGQFEAVEDRDETCVAEAEAIADEQGRSKKPVSTILDGEVLPHSTNPKAKVKEKPTEGTDRLEKKVLAEAKAGVGNKKRVPKKLQTFSTLEKVTEEENDENKQPNVPAPVVRVGTIKPEAVKVSKADMKSIEQTEPKRKKRKLLGGGKTLFDEEDGEATKRPHKLGFGLSRLREAGCVGLDEPKVRNGTAFGAFSPLKKDRRGIGASFLA